MQISSGKVVSIDYTLTDDNKQVLDSSEGGEPLSYLHGNGQIIPGLEKELEGKAAGDKLSVKVAPKDGYGERDDAKIVLVPRKQIEGDGEIKVGTQLTASGPRGNQIVTVTKVDDENVTIDGNHPLAGQNLNFEVTVRGVRDATEEEVSHGHAHGPGGHHHH